MAASTSPNSFDRYDSPKARKELAMAKKHIVDSKKDEKAELIALTQKGRFGARKIKRANILLLANTGKPDFEIAELLHTSWLTTLRTLAFHDPQCQG
jgi:hypothetical protein